MSFKIITDTKSDRVLKYVLPNIEKAFESGVREGLYQSGQALTQAARNGITKGSKSGRFYTRNGKRKQASAPGEYPGILEGKTLKSIDYKVRGFSQLEFGIYPRKGIPENLPTFLEQGTSKMEPRPTLGNANKEREKELENYLTRMPYEEITKL